MFLGLEIPEGDTREWEVGVRKERTHVFFANPGTSLTSLSYAPHGPIGFDQSSEGTCSLPFLT